MTNDSKPKNQFSNSADPSTEKKTAPDGYDATTANDFSIPVIGTIYGYLVHGAKWLGATVLPKLLTTTETFNISSYAKSVGDIVTKFDNDKTELKNKNGWVIDNTESLTSFIGDIDTQSGQIVIPGSFVTFLEGMSPDLAKDRAKAEKTAALMYEYAQDHGFGTIQSILEAVSDPAKLAGDMKDKAPGILEGIKNWFTGPESSPTPTPG